MSDDFFDEIGKRDKKRGAVQTGFSNASLQQVREQVDSAAERKSTKHGRFRQKTMRLEAGMLDEINEWADKLGLPVAQMERWLLARGMQALRRGERPEVAYRTTPEVKLP